MLDGNKPHESLAATALTNAVFSCRNVNVSYGGKPAVRNVNIDIERRQVLAMIGPPGCGKSSFIRCLNRMNDTVPGAQVTGQILLDGQDIYLRRTDPVRLRARVGMVFQMDEPCSALDPIATAHRGFD